VKAIDDTPRRLRAPRAGNPAADCDGDTELTLFDFLCFQNAFSAGCS
jgi:hypothetical protein